MVSEALSLPLSSPATLPGVLATGGFDVVSMGAPWSTDALSWEAFWCHRNGNIASASLAVMKDGSEAPLVTVSTTRKVLGFWTRPGDRRLVGDIVAHLRESGGGS